MSAALKAETSASAPSEAIPLDEAGTSQEVAEWVRQGRVILKVVETPWGVEFYLCPRVETK